MFCKHVLAVKLAEAFAHSFEDKLYVKEIDDQDFHPLLLQSGNFTKKFGNDKKLSSAK